MYNKALDSRSFSGANAGLSGGAGCCGISESGRNAADLNPPPG
jgi:hypothetical protein